MSRCLAALVVVVTCLAGSGVPVGAADYYWELGAGYYTGVASDNPTDEARWDWAVLSQSNTPLYLDYVRDHLNKNLALNPKQKYMIQLHPLLHLGTGEWDLGQANFLDYRYKPGVREEVLKNLRVAIKDLLATFAKPENIYGFSLGEEIPGLFGMGAQMAWAGDRDAMPPVLEKYRAEIEKERGKPLVWDDETRLWAGQRFAEALEEIHRTMKEAMGPTHRVFYWHHGGFTYLDERGEYPGLAADAPIGANGLYPCKWSDIVKPGVVEGLMGWPEHPQRWERTIRLAERFKIPFFSQVSHNSFMRLNSWADCLKNAKTRHPLNLGYFFFCSPPCSTGAWNDDPTLPADSVENLSLPNHVRRLCAQENIGTAVVNDYMRPRVQVISTLGTAKAGGIASVTVLVHNPATSEFYRDPQEATAKSMEVTLGLPRGCRLDSRFSSPAAVKIGDLPPASWRSIGWYVTVDKPVGEKYDLSVGVKCANRGPVSAKFVGDSSIVTFLPQDIRQSGYRWVESCLDGPAVKPWVTMEALAAPVKGPGLTDGISTLTYQGTLSAGRRLVISPQGQARLLNWYWMRPEAMGKPDASDPSGYAPFTDTYVVTGKYLGMPVGDVKKIRVTFEGKVADGAGSLVILTFGGEKGPVAGPQLGGLGEEWGEVSAVVDVPEGAVRLDRIHLYRAGNKGKIWYGKLSVKAADLPEEGQDVSASVVGLPPTIPGGSFAALTYTDQGQIAWHPKIRVQLWKEKPN